ncbi:uncharacterized protein EAF02_006558 [Botrytis sinoallii]|uniref:uncharacterized protein n=1 Tax=Botrytis sinoallii TaxID=1463999 RepID=UPI0019000D56|nr:uncharacterized protein EAF02_006558 [Botrytis sinoallii]KAF7881870.1 hypothetical protein EAF02_006558 [Botrytis sinoallii]
MNDRNVIGVASFLNESARYSDLALFEEKLAPGALGQNMTVVSINGAPSDQSPGSSTEANLDIQYVIDMANVIIANASLLIFETCLASHRILVPEYDHPSLHGSNEPYLDLLRHLLRLPKEELPSTISVSYGEDEQMVPRSYARQTCFVIAQLGARGTSVIVASGDKGVGTACMKNDGSNMTHFPPQFPGACPWVTSVSGVRYIDPEQAVCFSSGGFSDLWPRPSYQQEAVEDSLQTQLGDRQKGLFDPHGRAFPDLSAQSVRYITADAGHMIYEDGTSCAAPTFAGIIGLLNAARISSHLPPFGFLNPWLHSVGKKSLKEIVHIGSTGFYGHFRFEEGLNGSPIVPYASWNATPGWDSVTGLGTPDFG